MLSVCQAEQYVRFLNKVERKTGFEPAALSLGSAKVDNLYLFRKN